MLAIVIKRDLLRRRIRFIQALIGHGDGGDAEIGVGLGKETDRLAGLERNGIYPVELEGGSDHAAGDVWLARARKGSEDEGMKGIAVASVCHVLALRRIFHLIDFMPTRVQEHEGSAIRGKFEAGVVEG